MIKLRLVRKICTEDEFLESTAEMHERMEEWGIYPGYGAHGSDDLVRILEERIMQTKKRFTIINNYLEKQEAKKKKFKLIRNEALVKAHTKGGRRP